MPHIYVSSASGLCKFIFRQMLNHGSLAKSRIIFCKVVNKTLFYSAKDVPLIRLIQATLWPANMLDIYRYISSDLCEAYNRT